MWGYCLPPSAPHVFTDCWRQTTNYPQFEGKLQMIWDAAKMLWSAVICCVGGADPSRERHPAACGDDSLCSDLHIYWLSHCLSARSHLSGSPKNTCKFNLLPVFVYFLALLGTVLCISLISIVFYFFCFFLSRLLKKQKSFDTMMLCSFGRKRAEDCRMNLQSQIKILQTVKDFFSIRFFITNE